MSQSSDPRGELRPIRLGMVGGGQGAFIGAVHRIAARLDGQYELVAGALSSDAARALASGAELGIGAARCYSDYRDMARAEAARPDGIEAVAIVTPNHLHHPVACAFIDAGIHVICDKPLTTTLADALDLRQRAAARGVRFALTHNYSAYPLIRAARAMVAAGQLGSVRIVQVEYAQDWLAADLEATGHVNGHKQAAWRTDPALAGPAGCLGDIGTHAAQLAEYVSGLSPAEISADCTTFVPGRRVDDHVQVQLRYAQGARGLLWASQVACGEENHLRLRVYGTQAAIHWDQDLPNELTWHPAGEPARRLTRGMASLPDVAAAATRTPPGHPEGYLEAFGNLYRDFAEDLRDARAGRLTPARVPGLDDGVRSLAFVEAVLASSRANAAWTTLSVPA
ncbi:Gfo/Idh/MocA family protein [Sphaerotilus mobilis]|uniref:Putative dehydrogenase n=1 Tax=Sphaerotilus mobilis TaxID=47994 RepID=A0A4Q7LDN3_9BURK|nr:Gfo/Idh/MocA family oxidoreductase [Sphaerotilus mobilis]RZS52174.1 putative dehydrogenase [Sphaerotilus mobilis]